MRISSLDAWRCKKAAIATLRAFVDAKHLVTLRAENNVLVRETPVFNRETSFASMNTPGPFEKNATQAY